MAAKQTINQKIAELETITDWFYGDEFSLDLATEKYRTASHLAKEIETDLENLKNEITVIDKDFAKE